MAFHWASLAIAIAPRFAARKKAVARQWIDVDAIQEPSLPPLDVIVAPTSDEIAAAEAAECQRLADWERHFLASLEYETGRNLSQWLDAIDQFPERNAAIDYLRTVGEFTFRQSAWLTNIRANGGKPIYLPLPTIASNQEPETPPLAPISPDLAIVDFLAIVRSDGARERTFRQLSNHYHDLGGKLAWPPLSDRALSMRLERHGCRKWLGKRVKGGKRLTIVALPAEKKRRTA